MKYISILVPEGDCSLVNIEGTHQIFSQVNAFLLNGGEPPIFNLQLVGLKKYSGVKKGFFQIHPDVLIKDVQHTDLIIVPALQEADMQYALQKNADFMPWLIQM